MLQPQPLPAPEPIIKTVTEFKTLEIYQPPLPKAIVKLHKAMKTQTLKIGWNEMKKFLRINNRTKLWLFKLVEQMYLAERY